MSTLRISDAPLLPDVDGTEKIPTGGRGDYAISVGQIKDHIFQDVGKELVGLGNVDNTSDLDKPVSTAQQAALDLKADKTYVDTNLDLKADKTNVYTRSETTLALSTKADLVGGVIPSNQLPSYVDDVVEYTTSTLPIVGESGKIYITTDTNRTWRWSGNQYVEISNGGVSDSTLKLQTPRKIANVDFDGTQNIDIPHNNLIGRNTENSHTAASIGTANGSTQQEINDRIGNTWYAKPLGYELNARVMLENGDIVKNTIIGNTNDPNEDMAGWVNDLEVLDQQNIYPNYGITPSERLKVYVERLPIQAILKTDGTDETINFKAYVAAAKALGKPLVLPKGTIYISDTVDIDFRLELSGAGRDQTFIRFKNTIANKRMFVFKRGSGMSDWRNFTLLDNKHGTSEGIVFTDSRTDVGGGVWKCLFSLIEIRGFAVSHRYTSTNPLDGGSHAHCCEMLWQQCRFSNNKITAIVENCQAVNNMYIKCDGENFDTAYLDENIADANWPFFIDYAGGGINIIGGSWIGRGKLLTWLYPAGGTGLFQGSGAFKGQDIRFELRPTYNGAIIEEGIHGNLGASMHMSIEITNLKTLNYGATVDLFRFGGRCKAVFKNCEPVFGAGRLVVRQYPTLGRGSNTTIGAMADVLVENCGTTFYEKETSTPYGTYDRAASANVLIRNNHPASTNQSYSTDAQGFRVLNCGGDIQQLGQSFNGSLSPSRLAFNNDNPSSGFTNATQHRFCIPKYGRPLKAFMYKMAVRHAVETSVDLYLVKDVAQWVGSTFDVATDAVLVASGPLTVNKSGYFEIPINLTSNIVGNAFQSGFDSWLEGRMMFVIKGGNTFSGFFGVEYI